MPVGVWFSRRNFTVLQVKVFSKMLMVITLISAEISVETFRIEICRQGARRKYRTVSMFKANSLPKKPSWNNIILIAYYVLSLIVLYVFILQHLLLQKYRCDLSKMHSSKVHKSNKQTNKLIQIKNYWSECSFIWCTREEKLQMWAWVCMGIYPQVTQRSRWSNI